jgi:hypothetical protein
VERLDFSDIEAGLPVAYLRAPFQDCYFHLESPLKIATTTGPEHNPVLVVGYFVTQQEMTGDTPGWRIAIAIILTIGDDMLTSHGQELELELAENDPRGLLDAVNDLIAERGSHRKLTHDDANFKTLNLCAKLLLYLGLRSARLVNRPEKTRLLEQAKVKSGSERKRLSQRAADLYDYIEVGPERTMAQEHSENARQGGKVFWRRGYFRMQAYGPKWSLHRQRWIQPTLVNAELLSDNEPAPPVKDYRLGSGLGEKAK